MYNTFPIMTHSMQKVRRNRNWFSQAKSSRKLAQQQSKQIIDTIPSHHTRHEKVAKSAEYRALFKVSALFSTNVRRSSTSLPIWETVPKISGATALPCVGSLTIEFLYGDPPREIVARQTYWQQFFAAANLQHIKFVDLHSASQSNGSVQC